MPTIPRKNYRSPMEDRHGRASILAATLPLAKSNSNKTASRNRFWDRWLREEERSKTPGNPGYWFISTDLMVLCILPGNPYLFGSGTQPF